MAGGVAKGSSHKQTSSSSQQRKSGKKPPPTDPNPGPSAGDSKPTKLSATPKEFPARSPAANPKPPPSSFPHSFPGPASAASVPPFPDAAALGPQPPPTYGFHMLDRRTIVLPDGNIRSYFALPPDYQDFSPPLRPFDPSGRLLPPGHGGHGLEPGGWRSDKRFPPGGVFGPEGSRDRDDPFRHGRHQDHWNTFGLDGRGSGDGSMKRKFGSEEDARARGEEHNVRKDEFARQRQHLLSQQKEFVMPSGLPFGVGGRGDFLAGTSSPYTRDAFDTGKGDALRPSKLMKIDRGFDNGGVKHHDVDDPVALKKAFLYFAKLINENAEQREAYLGDGKKGRLHCVVCGRSSKDFADMHGLILHAYNSDAPDLRMDHLGLHKALCVLMGWNYLEPPDNSKGYQIFPDEEAAQNRDDLIMWPPMVIIHNTLTGKGKDGRPEGFGNKVMDGKLKDLGFGSGKAKSLYSKDGHLGMTLVKFPGDAAGLKEARRLAEYFDKGNHGRKGWGRVEGKDDESDPNLVEVDRKTGEKKRVFYGYLGIAVDLDKLDTDTRKKVAIESARELKPSK